MQGWNLAEQAHIVNALPPVSIAGGATADRFSMKNFAHATIIVSVGVSAAAFTKIIVRSCSAATSGTVTDIPFRVYKEETALGDTLGAKVDVAAAGVTPSANDNIFYVIELDAAELEEDQPWVEVALTNTTGNSVIACVIAVLSGARYTGSENATAIA
jgi:hypothetical protein